MNQSTDTNFEEGLPLVSRRLKEFRLQKILTQEELHEKSGVPLPTIKDIERGATKNPRPDTLRQLATVLNISPEDFRKEDRVPPLTEV